MKLLRALVALTLAQAAVFAAEKRPISPQDLWAIKRVGSPALSPGGRQVVFTVQEWSIEKNKSTTNLDYRVPSGNGLELYGVLQAQGVPSRLVVYPNENHWILSPQNAIYWHWEMQSWLARHIGGKPTLAKPTFASAAAK